MTHKHDTARINKIRLEILNKGFLTIGDIANFVPCGPKKAAEIYNKIRKTVIAEGLENCGRVIIAKRMLDFMGMTYDTVKKSAITEKEDI